MPLKRMMTEEEKYKLLVMEKVVNESRKFNNRANKEDREEIKPCGETTRLLNRFFINHQAA